MQVADDGVTGLGHDVGFLVGVDGENVFRRHGANPVLDRTRDATRDVDVGRDSGARLADLVGVVAPAVVGDRARTPDDAID